MKYEGQSSEVIEKVDRVLNIILEYAAYG